MGSVVFHRDRGVAHGCREAGVVGSHHAAEEEDHLGEVVRGRLVRLVREGLQVSCLEVLEVRGHQHRAVGESLDLVPVLDLVLGWVVAWGI